MANSLCAIVLHSVSKSLGLSVKNIVFESVDNFCDDVVYGILDDSIFNAVNNTVYEVFEVIDNHIINL